MARDEKRRDPGEFYPGGKVWARPGRSQPQGRVTWEQIEGKPQIAPLPDRYREDDMKGKINEIASKFATVLMAALVGWTACADVTVQKKRKDQIYNDELVVVDVSGEGVGIDTNTVRDIIHATVDGAARPLPPYLHVLDFDDCYTNDAAWYYDEVKVRGEDEVKVRGEGEQRNEVKVRGEGEQRNEVKVRGEGEQRNEVKVRGEGEQRNLTSTVHLGPSPSPNPSPNFACSARRRGGLLERNYDWTFDDAAEFVVKVSAASGRFASVGVANVGTNITEAMATSGKQLPPQYYKALPGHTVDGINSEGVAACVNVVDTPPQWGVRSSPAIHPLGAVRWVLDNATSAGMAASNLAARITFPQGWTQNFHYMIADATETWIVEDGQASKWTPNPVVPNRVPTMTNFRILSDEFYGEGLERYYLLLDGTEPITNAWFTGAYLFSTYPAWDSDLGMGDITNSLIRSAWASKPKEAHRGETFYGQSWWQTLHTSVYDITNRTLRICVQENPDWYVFAVPSASQSHAETDPVWNAEKSGFVPWATNGYRAVNLSSPAAVVGDFSFAHGDGNLASGMTSHAEGHGTTASGVGSHAEGDSCTASGMASHAEGSGCTASGGNSHAEGSQCVASGSWSHAEGADCHAMGDGSHASGTFARTGDGTNGHNYSFCWNGDRASASWYDSHGNGTFNLNPVGGLGGFWIGSTNLAQHINYLISIYGGGGGPVPFANLTGSPYDNAALSAALAVDYEYSLRPLGATPIRSGEILNVATNASFAVNLALGNSPTNSADCAIWVDARTATADVSITLVSGGYSFYGDDDFSIVTAGKLALVTFTRVTSNDVVCAKKEFEAAR